MTSQAMPVAGSYAAAVQNPAYCFSDPSLRRAAINKSKIGQPQAMSGQFSVVFPVTSPTGQKYAVKCFTHDAPNQLRRYELIHDGLIRLQPRWATDFLFQPTGIRVEGADYPILRMDWVDGMSLITWLDAHNGDAIAIAQLAVEFDQLIKELSDAGIAHGDLQHGNILVQADGELRLVDYDGLYLPGIGLEQFPSDETGLPGYQPPGRSAADYGPTMDRFSAWLISLSLKALAAEPGLWDQLNPARGEYLLLDHNDFADPASSARMATLRTHPHSQVRELAERIQDLLQLSLDAMPLLGATWPGTRSTFPSSHTAAAQPSQPTAPSWLSGTRTGRTSPAASSSPSLGSFIGSQGRPPSSTAPPATAPPRGQSTARPVASPSPLSMKAHPRQSGSSTSRTAVAPRPQRPSSRGSSGKGSSLTPLWLGLAAIIVVAIIIAVFATSGSNHGSQAVSPGVTNPPSVAQQPGTPKPTLPHTASVAFDVAPHFRPQGSTVSGSLTEAVSDTVFTQMTLAPSMRGFELIVKVNAHYTPAGVSNNDPLSDFNNNCVDVDTPSENGFDGDRIQEDPLYANLTASGPNVTGTLTYAAVLPGRYGFDLECVGSGGQVNMGSVTTRNLGTAYGDELDNDLVVFGERKSLTDTVIVFGAVGGIDDGSIANPQASACIANGSLNDANITNWHAHHSHIKQRIVGHNHAETDQWLEVGTMTFNVPGSKIGGGTFNYDCADSGSTYVSLP